MVDIIKKLIYKIIEVCSTKFDLMRQTFSLKHVAVTTIPCLFSLPHLYCKPLRAKTMSILSLCMLHNTVLGTQ